MAFRGGPPKKVLVGQGTVWGIGGGEYENKTEVASLGFARSASARSETATAKPLWSDTLPAEAGAFPSLCIFGA